MVIFTLTVSNALEYHAYGSLKDREKRMNRVNTFHGSATKERVGWRVEERQNECRGGENRGSVLVQREWQMISLPD